MIKLRDYAPSDLDRLVELANNRNVSRYLVYTFPYPYTEADGRWWLSIGSLENGAITKGIEYRGNLVGTVGITPQIGWRSHLAEIGYWIGEEYWGLGIASSALQQMTDLAFANQGYSKLFAPVLAPNCASARVLEKNGYECEGILKQEVVKDGEFFDIRQYAKLRE